MSDQSLFAVSLDAAAAVLNILVQSVYGADAVITWLGENDGGPGRADWFRQSQCEADELAAAVHDFLHGHNLLHSIKVRAVPLEDWAESWKKHFPAIHVTRRLAVAPPWLAMDEGAGLHVVRLEPGLSFGTGQHGTTKACLFLLDCLQQRLPEADVMDIGCGSGILAIASVKLGFSRVVAFDNDPEAVRIARENAVINGVADQIEFGVADLKQQDQHFSPCGIVVANILASVLLASVAAVRARLANAPGSVLVLSGILTVQYEEVRHAYMATGFDEIMRLTIADWTTGGFELRG